MRHDFAPPPPPLSEFRDEVSYLTEFLIRWKLRMQGIEDKETGVLNAPFLAQWVKHRKSLDTGYTRIKRGHKIIPLLITFVDELVLDWFAQLLGITPDNPLDEQRLSMLEKFWQKLNDIPGDKWEIKY